MVAVFALLMTVILALKSGAVPIQWSEVFAIVGVGADVDPLKRSVLLELRLPRVLFAAVAGGALALSGAVMQALFRNPLAEPGLVGISAGASLGVVLTLLLGFNSHWFTSAAGFIGAMLATLSAYFLGRRYPGVAGLLLAGIAINATMMSVVSLVTTFISESQFRSFGFWSLGSLTRASWDQVGWLLPWTLICSTLLLRQWRVLNALLLGEREAHHLGFDIAKVRRTLILLIALLVGPLVAATGGIAFIGLVIPHILRGWVGAGHRVLLPLSWVAGAIALVLADWLARVAVMPAEIPVGVITSLVGGPFFIALLLRHAKRSA
ncbi:iron ABC transporter permease [Alcaligenaceae bacterium LF4-65]|jgi:iron complex transport system permease protein|uniref:Iron ABC transporter permease n=1 Tax=Zwartia hollandica TaxID=324606 RepID=A0A953T5K7_9BURK|nr:iron ABC transporter permease [Zwartia hollandica]